MLRINQIQSNRGQRAEVRKVAEKGEWEGNIRSFYIAKSKLQTVSG